jgi:hypothetical protein
MLPFLPELNVPVLLFTPENVCLSLASGFLITAASSDDHDS